MGITYIVRDSERLVHKITFLTRLGVWGSVREKTATLCKLIPKKT